jgi:hypothetical protein
MLANYKISTKRNTSGDFALLGSLQFNLVIIFNKNTEDMCT